MLGIQAEIEDLAERQLEIDDLELVDTTGKHLLISLYLLVCLERQNLPADVERDLNGDIELDYNEEPDSSYRQQQHLHDDAIKSPPPEGINFYPLFYQNRRQRHFCLNLPLITATNIGFS